LDLQQYLQECLLKPLGIVDMTFVPDADQINRLVKMYTTEEGKHHLIPEDDQLLEAINARNCRCFSGATGLFALVGAYDALVSMLANEGEWNGTRTLQAETVILMQQEGAVNHLEPIPGTYWGLGMMVFTEAQLSNIPVAAGTNGWSGAFDTHMFYRAK
jgi:CubicO group peptidase (beta-lactamase class C family)